MGTFVRVAVKETDRGWNALKRTLKNLKEKDSYVKIGVLDDGGKGSEKHQGEDGKKVDITTAELAAIMEFGTKDGKIPSRPFLTMTFEANKDKYIADLKLLVKGVYEQKIDIERALNLIGAKMAADIKKTVTLGDGVPPPNADSTLLAKMKKGEWKQKSGKAKKSKDDGPEIAVTGEMNIRTLIDTARMIGAVTWAVVMSGRKEK